MVVSVALFTSEAIDVDVGNKKTLRTVSRAP